MRYLLSSLALAAIVLSGLRCAPPPPGPTSRPAAFRPASPPILPGLAGPALYQSADAVEKVRFADDGVTLARGVLIEDDAAAFGLFDPGAAPGQALRKAAAGPTDTPYWEGASRTTWLRKTLLVGPVSAKSARLMFFAAKIDAAATPLVVQVNGKAVSLAAPGPAGPRWWQVAIDPALLKTGENEIVLRTDSDSPSWFVLIAPLDQFVRGSTARRSLPERSFRSDDAGASWRGNRLGRNSIVDGEYAVRLRLDQHVLTGRWTSPVLDLAAPLRTPSGVGPAESPIRQAMTFQFADGQILQAVPPSGRIDWEIRTGSLANVNKDNWGKWSRLALDAAGRFTVSEASPAAAQPQPAATQPAAARIGRYAQLRATLFTGDPAVSPAIRAVQLIGREGEAQPIPPCTLLVTDYRNPRIVRTSLNFAYETMTNARFAPLDAKFELNAAVRGARTQFEQATEILKWLGRRSRQGLFQPNQSWNAADILGTQMPGARQALPYQIVLCEALLSRGITARMLLFATPAVTRPVVEFWSNDYGKWVLMDGQAGQFFIDAATAAPLGAVELHERVTKRLASISAGHPEPSEGPALSGTKGSRGLPGPEIIRFAQNDKFGDRLLAPGEHPPGPRTAQRLGLRVVTPAGELGGEQPVPDWLAGDILLVPRNNFLSADRPVPLNVEWTQPGWRSLEQWTGGPAAEPAMPWLAGRLDRPRDFNWSLNQAEMEVHYGKADGELWVYLHTVTPAFDTFQASVDDAGWKAVPANFHWLLVPGPNSLKVRVRNRAGAFGPASSIQVRYFPAALPLPADRK